MYKPKKSLGQNFLKSTIALKKIVEAGEISLEDVILEIGPGKGALTEKLLSAISTSYKEADGEKSGYVIAIEKDHELFEFLKEKFKKEILENKLILIKEDILNFNTKNIFKYKIIANIPYNITGAILKKFLTEENQPELMVLMVQNEVAKRITGINPTSPRLRRVKESILSISVKAYGEPKMIMKVPARYFSPSPKVDSAVISIKNISKKIFSENKITEEKFWEILHAGFAHKRKKLSSNLKKYIGPSYVNILKNKRAEELTLTDWINLVKSIDIHKK